MSDYVSEAEALADMYGDDFDGTAEWIARKQSDRLHTIAVLSGICDHKPTRKQVTNEKFVIVQDSRKDGTSLMLVDRRKSKKFWWTHDFSLALKGCKSEMQKVANKLKHNNVRVLSYNQYFTSV